MAWTQVSWACGHQGRIQLYGKHTARESKVAWEAGNDCMACWLIKQWKEKNDPRALREDREELALAIAEAKGKSIDI